MPYASSKQRGYMHAAADRGDIPRKVVDEFDRESKGKKLPMRKSDLMGPSHKSNPGEKRRSSLY